MSKVLYKDQVRFFTDLEQIIRIKQADIACITYNDPYEYNEYSDKSHFTKGIDFTTDFSVEEKKDFENRKLLVKEIPLCKYDYSVFIERFQVEISVAYASNKYYRDVRSEIITELINHFSDKKKIKLYEFNYTFLGLVLNYLDICTEIRVSVAGDKIEDTTDRVIKQLEIHHHEYDTLCCRDLNKLDKDKLERETGMNVTYDPLKLDSSMKGLLNYSVLDFITRFSRTDCIIKIGDIYSNNKKEGCYENKRNF